MKESHQQIYMTSLGNFLTYCHITERFAEMPRILDLLAAITPHSPLEKTEIAHNLAYYRLLHAMNTQAWQLVGPLTDDLQAVAQAHGTKIPKARLTAIQYNVAIAYFFLEDHKKALQALNNILNDKQSQHREDLQQAARLLQAVVHYELGNHDLLEYLLRALKRYLQTKGGLHAFEATLVKALRDLLTKPHLQAQTMTALKEKLEILQNDPANAHAPGLEEMQHWVNARLLNRPIKEMLGRE